MTRQEVSQAKRVQKSGGRKIFIFCLYTSNNIGLFVMIKSLYLKAGAYTALGGRDVAKEG